MALWKTRGGSLNQEFDFRSWHCARGSLNKELGLDHGIVEDKGKFK